MGNQIALRLLSEPGDELIGTHDSHIFLHELGGPAVHSGLVMKPLSSAAGRFPPEEVRAAINPPGDLHAAPTRVAHDREHAQRRRRARLAARRVPRRRRRGAGARARRPPRRRAAHERRGGGGALAVRVGARGRHGHALPLEGARLPARRADRDLADRAGKARRFKHLFGGAMRQAGIVAAAGIYGARPPRRAARRRSRERPAARRGARRRGAPGGHGADRDELRPAGRERGRASTPPALLARFRAEGVLLSFANRAERAPGRHAPRRERRGHRRGDPGPHPCVLRGGRPGRAEAAEAPTPY